MVIIRYTIAILLLFLCGAVTNAQCGHNYFHTYSTTYSYPVREVIKKVEVLTPYAVPVLIPAFQYQYHAPCVPVNSAPVVQQNQQHSHVQQNAQVSQKSDDIRELAKLLLAEIKKQQNGGQEETVVEDDGLPVAVDFPQLDALTVLKNHCARCHTGSSSEAGIKIFDEAGNFNNQVNKARLYRAVRSDHMPPKARTDPRFKLSLPEKEVLKQFAGVN